MTPGSGRLTQLNLDALDPEQLGAATAPRGPVSIIAGAGTGKTRTITHRIAHLVSGGFVNPDHVLAVTFTNRAAAELRERLTMMGVARVQAKTFHAAAMQQLRYFWPKVVGDTPWELLDSKFPLVARVTRATGTEPDKTLLSDLLGEIEWAKASLISPVDYPSHIGPDRRDCPVDPAQFVRIFEGYEKAKVTPERALLDFDDLLESMAGLLETNVGVADEFRSRYRTFVVDEYQDVTPLQQRLLDAWLGDRDDLTVVDANQTIYSFNRATDHLLHFSSRFPEAAPSAVRDYRSTAGGGLAGNVISRHRMPRVRTRKQRPAGPDRSSPSTGRPPRQPTRPAHRRADPAVWPASAVCTDQRRRPSVRPRPGRDRLPGQGAGKGSSTAEIRQGIQALVRRRADPCPQWRKRWRGW